MQASPQFLAPSRCPARLAILLAALFCCAGSLRAQEQESVAMQRMLHPDQTLKFNDSDRKFDGSAAIGSKQAVVHPFLFSHAAATKTGDGVFRTRDFGSTTSAYHAANFATKTAPAASQDGYAQTSKLFAVKAVAVHDDRAAGQTLNVRDFISADKPFLGRGKRQDTIDDLRSSKDLTVEQVRELLNKNK